jgi:putative hemolysin
MALVELIRKTPLHMVLVHVEYGHFEGVVTNADILEAIIGSFQTDAGTPEPDAVLREDGSCLIAGSMVVDASAYRSL